MVKLRKVTKDIFNLWRCDEIYDKTWPYYWIGNQFGGWPDFRACVPGVITGLKDNVIRVYHAMKVDCACPKNSNATVVCLAELDNPHGPEFVKCFHKPGQCPHLTYEALPKTGEADDTA